MPDIFSRKKRSAVMAVIRSHGNKATELRLMQVFRAHGITGWRRGSRLPGRPDFVFRRSIGSTGSRQAGSTGSRRAGAGVKRAQPVAVFVDGCFWHGCPKHGTRPKTRAGFWRKKIEGNRARDRRVDRVLRAKGWRVVRIWEHALRRRDEGRLVGRLKRLGL